jgi:hypothetical protein
MIELHDSHVFEWNFHWVMYLDEKFPDPEPKPKPKRKFRITNKGTCKSCSDSELGKVKKGFLWCNRHGDHCCRVAWGCGSNGNGGR